MADSVDSPASKEALSPGSLVHVGGPSGGESRVSLIRYGPDHFQESEGEDWADLVEERDPAEVLWLRVRGVSDLEAMSLVEARFGLHPLLMEDVINTQHRPKLEEFDDCLFLVGKRLLLEPGGMEVEQKQVSLILGPGWIISFGEEAQSQAFAPMIERLRQGKGRARGLGPDYLFCALLDIVVDTYFGIVDGLEDRLEELETEVMEDPREEILTRLYHLKRRVLRVRRTVWPMREITTALVREGNPLLSDQLHPFVRDIQDHAYHVLEAADALRENLSALMDLFLSRAGHRMNQIMKVLTVIATIFIPLTFLAGIYGMNFKYMPELDLPWAYFALLGLMGLVALGMIGFFRRKKWF
jgi:magnesium transporter